MTKWWSKPQLRSDDEPEERKVGFLDLFYDLIFVVAIAQVAHGLAKHPDGVGAMEFALVFLPIAWLWMGNTFYTDRHETNDVSHRFFTFLQMLPVVGIAVFAHGALHDTTVPFIISYVIGRGFVAFLWTRGGFHNPENRRFSYALSSGFSVGIALWVISIWVHGPLQQALWIAGIVVDLGTPQIARLVAPNDAPFSKSRLTERFGLFTIIVLGESVAGTANGLAELHGISGASIVTGILAMAFAFSLFWVYFEMVPREELKPGPHPFQWRSYLHLPLLGALTATGAGILAMVGHGSEVVDVGVLRVLSWSLALALLSLFGLSRLHVYQSAYGSDARFRTELCLLLGVAISIAVGIWGVNLHPLELLSILWGVLMILIAGGIIAWALNRVQVE